MASEATSSSQGAALDPVVVAASTQRVDEDQGKTAKRRKTLTVAVYSRALFGGVDI